MSEEERQGQPQHYCGRCGTKVRPGDAFCASCGKQLGTTGPDPAVHDPAPEEPDADGTRPGGDPRDKAVSPSGGRAGQAGPGGERSWSEVLRDRARWFEELPMVSKALLGGVAILVALPLLVLLSPLALVASPLLLGVGLIGLIVRLGQRRSAKGWGIFAVGSLALMVVSGYLSVVVYGSLFDGSATGTGSGSNKDARKQATADERNTRALRDAAYKPSPLGVIDQQIIGDLRVTGDTVMVELTELTGPGSKSPSWQATRERGEGKLMCGSAAKVAAENDIPVATVKVMNVSGKEVASCNVEQDTTVGKNKQKQRTTADRR